MNKEHEFEWHERKRPSSIKKHNSDFVDATEIFDG